jgi:hypothetical protein
VTDEKLTRERVLGEFFISVAIHSDDQITIGKFDFNTDAMADEIVRLRERLAAIDTLHKQWVVKFLSGHGRSRGAQQIIDALTEILHKKEGA